MCKEYLPRIVPQSGVEEEGWCETGEKGNRSSQQVHSVEMALLHSCI